MSMARTITGPKNYDDGRTKQSFKDQCDINKMLNKAAKTGSIAHLMKYDKAVYGEFDGEFTLLDAQNKLAYANQIFSELPSEIRNEFNNNALDFVNFAGDPANNEKLGELFPALAEPGKYFPNPVERGGVGAGAATAPQPEANAAGAAPPGNPPPAGDAGADPAPAADPLTS